MNCAHRNTTALLSDFRFAWQARGGAGGAARADAGVGGTSGGAAVEGGGLQYQYDSDGGVYGAVDDFYDGDGECTEHETESAAELQQWVASNVEDYFANYDWQTGFNQRREAFLLSEFEPRLQLPACPACAGGEPSYSSSGERRVTLVFAGWYTLDITVPLYYCSGCVKHFQAPAAAIGFFPSTVKMAERLHSSSQSLRMVWFERDFMAHLYALQHCSPQLAIKACAEAMAVVHGGVCIPASRLEALLGPSMERHRAVDFRLRRADTAGCEDYPPEQGLVGACSARCHLAGKRRSDGSLHPLPDINLDACMGVKRFAGAAHKANAARTEPLVVHSVMPVHERDGAQLLPGVEDIRRGGVEYCEDIYKLVGTGKCESSCSSFRAVTGESRKHVRHDQTGVMAGVCHHGVTFLSVLMNLGEKYAYAAMILMVLHKGA